MAAVVGTAPSYHGEMSDDINARSLKKRKLTSDGYDIDSYNDGNIVNIKLKNFVTYSNTKFTLSPTLNMIIGPNGTGKSTFVCAVCLGLGGKPELLGRQKHAAEFIKEGQDFSSIETVLKFEHNGKKTVTVRREMTRNSKVKSKEKSEWFIDEVKRDEKSVKKLLERLNIQLNNLCCFLPQDKVSSFAALSPEKLLVETERAAGDGKLLEQHEQLTELDEDRATIEKELRRHEEQLAHLEASRDRLKEEVEKFLRFKEKKDQLNYHEKLLPYAIVQDRKKKAAVFKERRNHLQKQYQKFSRNATSLDDEIAHLDKAIAKKEHKIRELEENNSDLRDEYKTRINGKKEIDRKMEKYESEKAKLESRSARKYDELMRTIDSIAEDKAELANLEFPSEDEIKKVAELKQEARRNKNDLETEISSLVSTQSATLSRINQLQRNIQHIQRQIDSNDKINIYSRFKGKMQDASKQAVLRLRELPELKGKVFEPPILSVSVKDDRYSKFLEILIDNNTRFALTAKSKEVYDEVANTYFKDINVGLRYSGEKGSTRKFTKEEVQELGFDGYLVDFIKGPQEVVKMLYDSVMYDVPVALGELTSAQLEKIQSLDDEGKPLFTKFAVGDLLYSLTKSDYGSHQVVSSATPIKTSKFAIFTSQHVDQESVSQIKELQQQIREETTELEPIKQKINDLSSQADEWSNEYDINNKKHGLLVKRRSAFKTLTAKIERKEETAKSLKAEAEKDVSSAISRLDKKITTAIQHKLKAIEELVDPVVEINKSCVEIAKLEFEKFELINRKVSIDKMMSKFTAFKQRLRQEVELASSRYNEAKKNDEIQKLKQQTVQYSDELREKLGELAAQYQSEDNLTEIHIRGIIAGIRSEIGSLEDASSSSIEKLESIEARLNDLNESIPDLQNQLEVKEQQIFKIKGPWEAKLDELVSNISDNFSRKFVAVASAGEVRLNKEGALRNWRLELLVKFRDESELRVLGPFVQSGGEMAVSTIFFMLSLQGLTNSPFRVVDEINQGMDPKNESIVHKYMVESACQTDEHGSFSQYFLITPKLLTNLFYHEKMAVHCIMANHKLPSDLWD